MKWHDYTKEHPKKEKEYLCCDVYDGKTFFSVARWSNNLRKVDKYDFTQSVPGFYDFDSEWGYTEVVCDYWTEIDGPEVK